MFKTCLKEKEMKIAIVGSRELCGIRLEEYVGDAVDEIVSGGAAGVDACAAAYAREKGLKLREFLPQYELYGRAAPIVRNREIVDYADEILAFWDGCSKGTQSVIRYAKKTGKPLRVILIGKK